MDLYNIELVNRKKLISYWKIQIINDNRYKTYIINKRLYYYYIINTKVIILIKNIRIIEYQQKFFIFELLYN